MNYEITKDGKVINKKRNKELKPQLLPKGYVGVNLVHNGKRSKFLLHRLIAEKYIHNPENKPCINHINGIKNDNRIENLEWVTYKENCEHRNNVLDNHVRGERCGTAKLKNTDAIEIREKYKNGKTLIQISNEYNVTTQTIWSITNNKTYLNK